jgi:hypothetical protein
MATPFTHAIVDDMGDIIRKYRWSSKEAKWHKEQGSIVIKLEVIKEVEVDAMSLVGECLF